jgi:hypothetical protein
VIFCTEGCLTRYTSKVLKGIYGDTVAQMPKPFQCKECEQEFQFYIEFVFHCEEAHREQLEKGVLPGLKIEAGAVHQPLPRQVVFDYFQDAAPDPDKQWVIDWPCTKISLVEAALLIFITVFLGTAVYMAFRDAGYLP